MGRVAIVGIGSTKFTRASGVSVLELATAACRDALADAGLPSTEADGFITYGMGDTVRPQALAFSLGARAINYMLDIQMGGTAPCYLISTAAALIQQGMVDHVLVWRAMNGRSGNRIGSSAAVEYAGEALQRRREVGVSAAPTNFAMWARRYLEESHLGYEAIGAVPVTQRSWAAENERARIRKPLTMAEYLESELIADPLRIHDCATEVDGASAVLLTSEERARDLAGVPVFLEGSAYAHGPLSGLDVFDFVTWPDMTRNSTAILADKLRQRAGFRADQVDAAQIYDCFSINVLLTLEGMGFAERGTAGPWLLENNRPGGVPINTHGGMVSEGYLHGMNTVIEAVRRVRRWNHTPETATPHGTCLVTSGGPMWSSGLVLTNG